jgi:hypothetical protein
MTNIFIYPAKNDKFCRIINSSTINFAQGIKLKCLLYTLECISRQSNLTIYRETDVLQDNEDYIQGPFRLIWKQND